MVFRVIRDIQPKLTSLKNVRIAMLNQTYVSNTKKHTVDDNNYL